MLTVAAGSLGVESQHESAERQTRTFQSEPVLVPGDWVYVVSQNIFIMSSGMKVTSVFISSPQFLVKQQPNQKKLIKMENPCYFSVCLILKSGALGNCHSFYHLPKTTSCRRHKPALKVIRTLHLAFELSDTQPWVRGRFIIFT